MEVIAGCRPVPDKLILAVAALLVTDTLPDMAAVPEGAKVTFKLALCPGVRIVPETPAAVKPAPEMLVLEMLTFEVPEFVKATLKLLLVPTVVLPKLKLDGLVVSTGVVELTLRTAALLVEVPAELLTTRTN